MSEIKDQVRQQFGANASAYVNSAVHAKGSDLARLAELAGLTGQELVLDVATAVGHTALALAKGARQVIGVDLTEKMLAEARKQAELKGVTNVAFAAGDAEALFFPDGHFDLVTCRIAAHHFPNVQAFCREAARVLKPGGLLLVVDNIAPEDAELDAFINAVEKLRDPSHFRAYRLSEWQAFLAQAGLPSTVDRQFPTSMDREDWLRRMSVPADVAADIRRRMAEAAPAVKECFGITQTHFTLHKAIIVGRKPSDQ